MNTISLKMDDATLMRLHHDFQDYEISTTNPYIVHAYKHADIMIQVYSTGKVVFQGPDANNYASAYLQKKIKAEAGSDEVGTGDYFGPVCVCACALQEKDSEWLSQHLLQDSKLLSDTYICKIAPQLMERLTYSLLILKPKQYNEIYPKNNAVAIKAKMHNQAYIHLRRKLGKLPNASYVDQFTPEDNYYRYLINEKEVVHGLIFETKAESAHPAVAAASMIARYAFLREMEQLSQRVGFNLHKGAGEEVDRDALLFIEKFGMNHLHEIAKLHFKNTEKIRNLKK